ncbi:hypothetical protein ACIO3O_03320 [Streptomyces sp. NPDC087440]|uniref:hypothetical protein n=1 Tax=Streptomyces sp. NPDC087440 TaxID=3365790 RepID=UPI0038008E2B
MNPEPTLHQTPTPTPTFGQRLRALDRPLLTALVLVACLRPLFSIVGLNDVLGKPTTPLVLTALITLAWILLLGLVRRVREPLLLGVAAGMGYALATVALSAVLSPILTGELQGPPAQPIAIVPIFLFNAGWGAVCGVCALGLRRLRRG